MVKSESLKIKASIWSSQKHQSQLLTLLVRWMSPLKNLEVD